MSKKWVHRMLSVNIAERTGVCANCGPVRVKRKRNGGTAGGGRKIRYSCMSAEVKWGLDYSSRAMLGLTPTDVAEMIARQDGRCATCLELLDLKPKSHFTHVDHDHESGTIRGVLCRRCNLALGFIRDSPLTAERIAAYLRKRP